MSGTGGHGRRRAAGGGGGTAAIAAMLHGSSTETPAPTLAPSQSDHEVMLSSMAHETDKQQNMIIKQVFMGGMYD